MRLIFITNFYPPAARGGYELWCQEVAEHLGGAGHEVVVLTSRSASPGEASASGVRVARELYLEMEIGSPRNVGVFFFDRERRTQANLATADRWLHDVEPDAVVIWGMWNIDRSLAALVERRCGDRTVYYFGDYWPTLPTQWRAFWDAPASSGLGRVARRLLKGAAARRLARDRQPALAFPHGLFPSEFMRRRYERAGVAVRRSSVVPGGVATAPFRRPASQADADATPQEWRVLVAGRLTPEKGIDTAVKAIGRLAAEQPTRAWRLTVVGTGDESYVTSLRDMAADLGIGDRVRFVGAVPASEMPRWLHAHDVFVFPSVWDEPFGRVLVEAMAARVPVVGTTVGGAGEILRDGETGLTFAPGDVDGLAHQLERVACRPELRDDLTARAQAAALANFDTSRMAQAIERYLEKVIQKEDRRRCSNELSTGLDTLVTGY